MCRCLRAGLTDDAGSPDECRTTAEDAIQLVNNTVTTSQEFLDELDKGYNCKYEGIAEVNSANETKIQADAAVVEASASMTAAYRATVTLGTQSLDALINRGDECGWVMVSISPFLSGDLS